MSWYSPADVDEAEQSGVWWCRVNNVVTPRSGQPQPPPSALCRSPSRPKARARQYLLCQTWSSRDVIERSQQTNGSIVGSKERIFRHCYLAELRTSHWALPKPWRPQRRPTRYVPTIPPTERCSDTLGPPVHCSDRRRRVGICPTLPWVTPIDCLLRI
jgi:hypothetical protein